MQLQPKRPCKWCGEFPARHFAYQCRENPKVKSYRIPKIGKETIEYNKWRDTVAKPYLDKKYGRVCQACFGDRCGNKQLDVEHTKGRGGHHELKMVLSNVTYMGRYPCHFEKTNNIKH